MINNFIKLKSTYQDLNLLKQVVLDETLEWDHSMDICVKFVARELIKNKSMLTLMDKFNTNPVILKFISKSSYRWHKDINRDAALNVVIQSSNSHTVFGTKGPTGPNYSDIYAMNYIDLDELIYEPTNIYLLNTSNMHSVLNLGDDRIIFSLGFPKPTTYIEVRDFCIENNL